MTARVTLRQPPLYDCHGNMRIDATSFEMAFEHVEDALAIAKLMSQWDPEVVWTSVPMHGPAREHVCTLASDGTEVWYERDARPRIDVIA